MEIGPFRLVPNSDGKLRELEGAWNEYANVIFSALNLPRPSRSGS
jgi:carboxypeptidase D